MAGSKETPRQKLVGLMYLVLLALLALQVSSAIMEKFKFLDDSLQYANHSAEQSNAQLEQRIKSSVKQAGNRASDLKVLEKAELVKQKSDAIRQHLEGLREELITSSGGFENPQDKGSMYKGAKDENPVEELMLGHKKASELQAKINGYCADLRSITGLTFPDIALDAKNDPRIGQTSEQKNKSFGELYFAQTPMVAAMAVLSNMESEVLKSEAKALEALSGNLNEGVITFDLVKGMFRAPTNTVVAGRKYTAEVFLGASSTALIPKIEIDGQPIQVDANGVGQLELTAKGGGYNALGFAQRKWSGKITVKQKGRDTTFWVEGAYQVAKPYVEDVSNTSVQLYKNCGNEIRLTCPPLGADFKPSYEGSTGGDILAQGEPGKIMIVPNTPRVNLKIKSGGSLLDEKNYNVRLIPLPTFKLKIGNQELDEKKGLYAPFPPKLQVEVVPDESFLKSNAKDARYKADEVEVSLIRRRGAVVVKQFPNGNIDLSFLRSMTLLPGDRLVIEVKKVLRKNFRDEVETVNTGKVIRTVSLDI